jgi:hypothetical protein
MVLSSDPRRFGETGGFDRRERRSARSRPWPSASQRGTGQIDQVTQASAPGQKSSAAAEELWRHPGAVANFRLA